MRGGIIGVCALLTAEAAQAQNGRPAFECTGTVTVQDVNVEEPASNSERTQPRRTVFILDEATGKILTYSSELAKYVEFCGFCKKAWSVNAVTWSDDHTEMKYDHLSFKSTEDGQIDWRKGAAYSKSLVARYNGGENETGQSKENAEYPLCVKIDVDTFDFESLSSSPEQQVTRAGFQKRTARRATPREDWTVQPLPDGAELRYLPLSVTKSDYPATAARAAAEGTSIVNLRVDTSGNLASCTTSRSSGSPILDQRACRLYRERGRFDLRGSTEPVVIQTVVQWVLTD
jgi:TonB family protein